MAIQPASIRPTINDFRRIDLRVAEVIAAEALPKSKKLLKLTVSLGAEQRTILAGIAQHYAPTDRVGKKVVVVANLEPAKLMGVTSEGMLLAAEDDKGISIFTPDKPVVFNFHAYPWLIHRLTYHRPHQHFLFSICLVEADTHGNIFLP